MKRLIFLFILVAVISLSFYLSLIVEAIPYTITDLGTLGSSTIFTAESMAHGINNLGQVIGEASLITTLQKHAFLWDSTGGMRDLGTLGGLVSSAHASNDLGQVVGESWLDTPGQLNIRAFLWDSVNGMQNLGSFGGHSFAYGINNLGQVVGASQETPGGNFSHAFLWDSINGMQNINDLIPPNSGWDLQEALDINDRGQIVGWGFIKIGQVVQSHTFLWDPTNGIQDLGAFGTFFVSINNNGQVTGMDDFKIAYLWDSVNGKQSLGTLGGYSFSRDINELGQVVGRSFDNGQRAFLYSDSTLIKLNDLIGIPDNGSSWVLEDAYGINNSGQIVGWGAINSGNHAFIMTPIPEPTTILLMSCGLLGLLGIVIKQHRKTK